jgi:predicted CopG family antitoxin
MEGKHLDEQPETEEIENNVIEVMESGNISTFGSIRNTVNKWGRVLALAAMMSGATAEAASKDFKEVKGKTKVSHVEKESVEYKKQEQVNQICHRNGFKIVDAHSGAMEVHLPPGEVKKVIVFLGQVHATGTYESSSKESQKEVVESQYTIFRMLEDVKMLTGKKPACLLEGVVSDQQVTDSFTSEQTLETISKTVETIVRSNSPIEKIVKSQTEAVSRYVESRIDETDKVGLKAVTLFDLSVANKKILQNKGLSMKERTRLEKLDQGYQSQIDHGRVAYKIGGAAIAARFGYVNLLPAEDQVANQNVALCVYQDLGINAGEHESFFEVINKLPEKQKRKAHELLATYAHSKERELPTLQKSEDQLKDKETVVVIYGTMHTFEDTLKSEYSEGRMNNTAMVKIDSRRVSFASEGRK